MGRSSRRVVAAIVVMMAVVALAGCSKGFTVEAAKPTPAEAAPSASPSIVPTNGVMQSHEGGSVTMEIKWLGIDGDRLSFSVAMNTHSVDLDGYDLGGLTVLRDDQGNEYRPVAWESTPGGHHRQGTLIFPVPDSLGNGGLGSLEMVIHDIAGIDERVVTWRLK